MWRASQDFTLTSTNLSAKHVPTVYVNYSKLMLRQLAIVCFYALGKEMPQKIRFSGFISVR